MNGLSCRNKSLQDNFRYNLAGLDLQDSRLLQFYKELFIRK